MYSFGRSPLHSVTFYGRPVEIVDWMVRNGADFTLKEGKYKQTVLHIAAGKNYIELVRYYLSKGMNKNEFDKDRYLPITLTSDPAIKTLINQHK